MERDEENEEAEPTEEIEEALVRSLGYEILRLSQRRHTSPPGTTLDTSAFRILWSLVETGPKTHRGLAEALQLEQSTIHRQVAAATKRNLVERVPDSTGTAHVVQATPKGEEAYMADGRLRATFLTEALEELGAKRAHHLVSELAALNDAVTRATERDSQAPPRNS